MIMRSREPTGNRARAQPAPSVSLEPDSDIILNNNNQQGYGTRSFT